MAFTRLLFSFDGRINRLTYWVATGLVGTIDVIAAIAITAIVGDWWAHVIVLPLTFSIAALNAKRLHDLGTSGWWQLMFVPDMLVMMVQLGPEQILAMSDTRRAVLLPVMLIGLVPALWATWLIFQMACVKGVADANRFGQPAMFRSAPLGTIKVEQVQSKPAARIDANFEAAVRCALFPRRGRGRSRETSARGA